MDIAYDVGLRAYNTFGISATARALVKVNTLAEVAGAVGLAQRMNLPVKVLGGGSNILLTSSPKAMIIKMEMGGISHQPMLNDEVLISAGAGCDWESLIDYASQHELWGVENLTLIPGKVGSSPIQNIGAYGVELKDVFHSLTAYDVSTSQFVDLDGVACQFGYRDSLFKNEGRGRYIITAVNLKLSARAAPRLQYGQVADALAAKGIQHPIPADVIGIIRGIRRAKLPDTSTVGTAGSFFKNPLVTASLAAEIRAAFPDAPLYPSGNEMWKVAAGWLIEQCGWKGFRRGDAGVWPLQALVLVNYGQATGAEIVALAHDIIESVATRFNIRLDPEVNIW